MSGASVDQQHIAAGLVDEIGIHLVPMLFGGGTRMFEHLGPDHIELELTRTLHGPGVTHLHYLVDKEAQAGLS